MGRKLSKSKGEENWEDGGMQGRVLGYEESSPYLMQKLETKRKFLDYLSVQLLYFKETNASVQNFLYLIRNP